MEGDKWFLMRRCSQPTKHFLEESPLEIGRSVTAFIICTCPHVSKNHATIAYQNGNLVYLRDNMTTNGTYVNGERIEPGRFCLLLEKDVISFGKPEEDMEDLNSEYCFQLLLQKQKPHRVTNENEAMNKKVLYLENLIEHQLEELHSLALYTRECNIAEAESCLPPRVTSKHIQDIEQQLEVIHSSTLPDVASALAGPILPPGQQEPPPKSPAVASGQDHSDAIPQISRILQPIAVQAPLLSPMSNVVQVNKVKPSPKCKKPNNTPQLEPQLESPNISYIKDNSAIAPELSRTIKLEILEANELVTSSDKDSFQVEQVQPVPELPQPESVPEISSSENVKLPEPSSSAKSNTSRSTKDKESILKKLRNAVHAESNKKYNKDTILSKSKKPQDISEKESPVSKKRTSQSAADDSSSKAKKPKKILEKEPTASTNSKRISQSAIDDGPSNSKRQKKNVSEQKPSDSKVKNAPITDNGSSKTNKSTKLPEKQSVSNKRTSLSSSVSLDKSSSKTHKTRKSVDLKPSDSSSRRTSKCEMNDSSSKGKKSKDRIEKDPPASKTRSTTLEKSSSKTKSPKKDSTDSKSKNSSKSVSDDSYSKSKKVKNSLEEEPSVSKRRSSQSAKDTSSSKAVKSKNKEPSDSDNSRTSKSDKNSTSKETKRSKESKSSSVFKITDSNLNKERRNSLSASKSNRRQSIMIEPLPAVTRRSSRLKAKLDSSETILEKLPSSNNTPLRQRSQSIAAINVSKPLKKTNEKPKTKKNHDASETLKEMQAKILSQLSFLAPPLQSTVERLAGSIRPRSYSMHDLASSSVQEAPLVPARICPPGILKRPSTDYRIILKKIRPRSYSIVERSVTFAPGTYDNQKDKTGESTTGGESSQSLNKSIKYGRSYSTVGFSSTTSPTHSAQAAFTAQAASTDTGKKRTGEESSQFLNKSTKHGRSYSTVGFVSTTSPTHSSHAASTDIGKKGTSKESSQSPKSKKYGRSYSTVSVASASSPTQSAPTDIEKKRTGEESSHSPKKSNKHSRSFSTVGVASASSPTQTAPTDIEKKRTGEESSHSPKKSNKYSRSFSTVGVASASSPTQTAPTDIEKKRTGEESSHSPKKSNKYSRSFSTIGVASATSPTQAAPTDVWKKREDPRRRPSIASRILDVLTQTTHQTADSTTDQISDDDSRGPPGTSESTRSSKPSSYFTSGRVTDPNLESKETAEKTARSTHDSNARETPATVLSHRNKPISRSYTMCDTLVSGKFTKEPQSRRNFLGNQSPRTPSPGGQSPGTSSSANRGGLERSTSYLGSGEGNQNIRQDRVGRKSNYDGDRRMSMYVSKAPSEESFPEYHKTFLAHIIRWNPAWLAEYMMHDTLPPIFHETKTDIPVMMYTYKNFEVYSDTQVCLVILEVWEATFAAYKETREKSDELDFTLLCSPPKAFTGTKITKVTLKINSKGIVTNGSRGVSYGTLLLVKFPELPKCSNHWFLAMIEETEYKNLANGGKELLVSIYVKLDPWQIASLSPNAVAKVKLLNSIKNELAMVRAVYELQTSKLLEQIVSPRPQHFRKFTNLSPMQWKHDLNPSQLKAVSQCICALTCAIPDIQIIQGPPGTGKSRVIVSIVMEYLQRTIRHNRGKVLICAQTNVAIDEIVLRLLEAREKMSASTKKFNMVRVGRCESMHPRALTISSTEMAKQFDNYPDIRHQISVLRKQIDKYSYRRDSVGPQAAYFKVQHQHYSKKLEDLVSFHSSPNTLYHEEMAIIEKADVIATTLQGCSLGKMQGLKNKITFCIVDEAAKATEPEILIPLALGVNNLVMVGDQQQLAAFVMSQHARKHGLSESLFSRLIHCCEFSDNSSMLPLNIQYRMHPDIAHFPNLAFYEGKLQDGRSNSPISGLPSPSALPSPSGMPPLCGLPPYRVVGIQGRSGDQDESGANADEAKMVARLALAIDTHVRENELKLSICVLTPYIAQKEAIQHKLRNLTTRRIEVSTVDSFQGQERDVVVVSCARSSGIGFLDDPGRMSVLLTRAKKSCIVCCNPEALCEHSLWAALIADADARLMLRPLPQTMPPYMNEEDNCRRFMSYLQ